LNPSFTNGAPLPSQLNTGIAKIACHVSKGMIFGPGKEPGRDADQLTATKVAGKKNMPSIAIVFIEELSSLLAFANKAELSASLMFIFMSFWVIYWKT
jgi:hypothetical protein